MSESPERMKGRREEVQVQSGGNIDAEGAERGKRLMEIEEEDQRDNSKDKEGVVLIGLRLTLDWPPYDQRWVSVGHLARPRLLSADIYGATLLDWKSNQHLEKLTHQIQPHQLSEILGEMESLEI